MSLHQDSQVIDALGGSSAVAGMCDVSSQAVSQWRRDGIPKARRMYLELLRPDSFAVLSKGAPDTPAVETRDAA